MELSFGIPTGMWTEGVKEKGSWLGLILRHSRVAMHPTPYPAWNCRVCVSLRVWAYSTHSIRRWTFNYSGSVLQLEHGDVQATFHSVLNTWFAGYLPWFKLNWPAAMWWDKHLGLHIFIIWRWSQFSRQQMASSPLQFLGTQLCHPFIWASVCSQSTGPAASLQCRTIPLYASIRYVCLALSSQKKLGIKDSLGFLCFQDQWSCPRTTNGQSAPEPFPT